MFWNKKKTEEAPETNELTAEQVDRDVFKLDSAVYVGRRTRINTKKRTNIEQVKEFWQACREDGTLDALRALADENEQSYVACCTDFKSHEYEYWIAVKLADPDDETPEGFERIEALEGEYAVFECTGPAHDAVDEKWKYIYTKWFSKALYNHGPGPEVEIYPFGDMESEQYSAKILVPVVHLQPVGERYKRRSTMGSIVFVAVGMAAGMLLGGSSDNYLIYTIVGGVVGYMAFSYFNKRMEERKNKKAEEQDDTQDGDRR